MTEKEGPAEVRKKHMPEETKFTAEQMLASERYRGKRDLVSALLNTGRTYTIAEVDQMISQAMKGRVR